MPSDTDQIVIGVDLDGVCADYYGRMRKIAAEWFERPVEELTKDVTYGLKEWGISKSEEYNSLHRFAVTQRDLFETMPMIPGARRYLRLLSEEKFRIRIITHRLYIPFFHDRAVLQTMKWLDCHGIPFWDLCFMKEKDQVGANIYVEDSPSNVTSLRKRKYHTICFANSTNKKIPPPRAETWEEVYNLVKRWESEFQKADQMSQ